MLRNKNLKKAIAVIMTIALLMCCVLIFVSGCGEKPTVGFGGKAGVPFIPGLDWGISRETAYKILKVDEEDVERIKVSSGAESAEYGVNERTLIKNAKLGGETVSLSLAFSSQAVNDKLSFDVGLIEGTVFTYDKQSTERISQEIASEAFQKTPESEAWSAPKKLFGQAVDQKLWEKVEPMLIAYYSEDLLKIYNVQHRTETVEKLSADKEKEIVKTIAETLRVASVSIISLTENNIPADDSKLLADEKFDSMFIYSGMFAAMLNHVSKQK